MVELAAPELPAISGAVKGTVAIAPTALGKPFQVVVPTFSADHAYEIRRWQSRGLTVPAVGDEVLIVEDEIGLPWVVAWWPAAGDIVGYRNYGIVEALPTGTIAKGSRCSFKAAAGIYWDLLYTEEATYPWAKIGGPPLRETDTASRACTSTSLQTTGAPTMNAPLKMEALVAFGAANVISEAAVLNAGQVALFVNAVETETVEETGTNKFDGGPVLTDALITVEKGKAVALKYRNTVATNEMQYRRLQFKIDPLRVG